MHMGYWWESQQEIDHWEGQGVDGGQYYFFIIISTAVQWLYICWSCICLMMAFGSRNM
jgi:hypothetical protein